MIRFAKDTLGRPPDESARRIAVRLLEATGAALKRVNDPDDEEALHDFRVNLRRLSSTLMAYRPWLQARAADRAVARIRELARSTNRARDYEVQIAWLEKRRFDLRPEQRYALGRLLRQLKTDRARAYAGLLEGIPEGFAELRTALVPKLESYRAWIRLDDEAAATPFSRVSGELIAGQARRLQRKLGLVRAPRDQARAHQARIQAKRLRYLIELLIVYRVQGGPSEERLEETVALGADGTVRAIRRDGLGHKTEGDTGDKLGRQAVLDLLHLLERGLDGLTPVSEARFLPDSLVGSIQI